MSDTPARRALTASALALLICGGCIVAFLPPLLVQTLGSVLRTVVVGLTLAVAALLHWVFLGIGAHRLQRSVAGWVSLSVLLFPIGSAAALVVLGLFGDEPGSPAPMSQA